MAFMILGISNGVPPVADPLGTYDDPTATLRALETPDFRPVRGNYDCFRIKDTHTGAVWDADAFKLAQTSQGGEPPTC